MCQYFKNLWIRLLDLSVIVKTLGTHLNANETRIEEPFCAKKHKNIK